MIIMSESKKTLIFVALALVFVVIGFVARPAAPRRGEFDDAGERFFAEFDPLQARSLEIISIDQETARLRAFKVAHEGGVWSIPSHENYPADAEDQLAGVAADVVDLIKGPHVSDRPADHALYGVVDPLGTDSPTTGAGTRVILKDGSGATLVDVIVGKQVKDQGGIRYVRDPGRDRVYATKISTTNLTTRFEDWIEDDLLEITPSDIREVEINDYSIDELNQRIVQGDLIQLDYDSDSATWTLADLSPDEKLKTTVVNDLRRALDDLKIIDVHRKPAGLSAELRTVDELQLDAVAVRSLAARGFYIINSGLISNEGETIVKMKSGVTYALRFGEIAITRRGGETALNESEDAQGESAEGEESDSSTASTGTARYLFVMAEFDATAILEPEYEQVPPATPETSEEDASATDPANDPLDEADIASDDRQVDRQRIIDENQRKKAQYQQKLEDGRTLVAELNDRFADWYYVISEDVYKKIRMTRADLVEPADDGAADFPPDDLGPLFAPGDGTGDRDDDIFRPADNDGDDNDAGTDDKR